MASPSPSRARGGGFAIALATLAGLGLGGRMGQPSAGVLAGFAIGAGVALALWLLDRR